jgi:hypothetical protein
MQLINNNLNYSKLKLLEEESSQQIKQLEAENRNLRIQLRKLKLRLRNLVEVGFDVWDICVPFQITSVM